MFKSDYVKNIILRSISQKMLQTIARESMLKVDIINLLLFLSVFVFLVLVII